MVRQIVKVPCKGCEYREVGCHGKCTAYQLYKQEKKQQFDNAVMRNDITAYIGDNVMRIRKCNRNKKYGCTVND